MKGFNRKTFLSFFLLFFNASAADIYVFQKREGKETLKVAKSSIANVMLPLLLVQLMSKQDVKVVKGSPRAACCLHSQMVYTHTNRERDEVLN